MKTAVARRKFLFWMPLTLFIVALVAILCVYGPKYKKLRKQNKIYRKTAGFLGHQISLGQVDKLRPFMPMLLQTVPYGEEDGIVLGTETIQIRGLPSIYNASLVEYGDGYLFVFRYDPAIIDSPRKYFAQIGCALLDKHFQQTEKEFVRLDMKLTECEDPRVFKCGDKTHVIFNAGDPPKFKDRKMYLATLQPETMTITDVRCMDPKLAKVEKNWVPFDYKGQAHFEYSLAPHKVLTAGLERVGGKGGFQEVVWHGDWGTPRGGSPAIHMGDHYLSFFHSSFEFYPGYRWYVMGAYTFNDKPPFNITRVSHYPILFDGIYSSPPMAIGSPLLRVVFPGGFVMGEQWGREVIHLVCAENDSAVKVVTLDKEMLYSKFRDL